MDTPRQRALRAWRERAEAIRAEQRARAKEAARWAQGAARSAREARYLETWQAIKDVDWVLPPREYWSATSRQLDELLDALQFVLRTGDPVAMEEAVRYLEADPWFGRSGYHKRDIIRRLTQLPLPPALAARLRDVVLRRVDQNRGQGLRHYCRLARAVETPALREALRQRLAHPEADVRRRAAWMLEALDAPEVTPPPGACLSRPERFE